MPFAHLKTYTENSLLFGYGNPERYVKRAKKLGHTSIALTERFSLRGIPAFAKAAEAHDIKPIFGLELAFVDDMNRRVTSGEMEEALLGLDTTAKRNAQMKAVHSSTGLYNFQLITLLAKNKTGLRNLFRLSSIAWLDGSLDIPDTGLIPRVDFELLEKYRKGIIVLSSGLDGFVLWDLLNGDRRKGLQRAEHCKQIFGNDFYLEAQAQPNYRRPYNLLTRVSTEYGIPMVATNGSSYILKKQHKYHSMILCIKERKKWDNPNRPQLPSRTYHLRNDSEMSSGLADLGCNELVIDELLDTAGEIAESCNAKLPDRSFKPYLPKPPGIPKNEYAHFVDLCAEGWAFRDIPSRIAVYAEQMGIKESKARKVYVERLARELKAIKKQGFTRYFLIVYELINWSRKNNVTVGPGRGSSGGSLVCYLLGITSLDPIQMGLMFERFINPERVDLPDIDMDFDNQRREEVIDHLISVYGKDKVTQISTYGRLKGKACVRDVARTMGIEEVEIAPVANTMITRVTGDDRPVIKESFESFKACQKFRGKYPDTYKYMLALEGQIKFVGIHAAGVICSSKTIRDVAPIELREKDGRLIPVTAFDMKAVQRFGLLKLDVLGLTALGQIALAVNMIEARNPGTVDNVIDWLEAIPITDEETIAGFTARDYVGIFQFDSSSASKIAKGIEFQGFEDVVAINALNRPGPLRSGVADIWKGRKQKGYKPKGHKVVKSITKETLGILIYQEQITRIFIELAGYAPGEADKLRKVIAKSQGDVALEAERDRFIEAVVANGMEPKKAKKLFDRITFFGSYGFNKSHAAEYGLIAFWGMYLKTHYPLEYFYSLLVSESDKEKITKVANDTVNHGILIRPPDINKSSDKFTIDGDTIRGSLIDIKYVSENAGNEIMEKGPFKSFPQMLDRVVRRKVTSRVIRSLIQAGSMKSLLPNTKWALDNLDTMLDISKKKKPGWKKRIKQLIKQSKREEEYTEEDLTYLAAEVSPLGTGKHPISVYRDLLDTFRFRPVSLEDEEELFNGNSVFVTGVIRAIKLNQVGDYHSGEPTELEKVKMGWGKRYASVNIEDESGKQRRIKIDYYTYDSVKEILDAGVGASIFANVVPNPRYDSLKATYVVALEPMRQRDREAEPFESWERVLVSNPLEGKKPFTRYKNKYIAVSVIVVSVRKTVDKNGRRMAHIILQDSEGNNLPTFAFSSSWATDKKYLKPGNVLRVQLKRENKNTAFLERVEKKLSTIIGKADNGEA